MAIGVAALQKIQVGKETTPGTSVAATAILQGKIDLEPAQTFYRPEDINTGRISSFERSAITGQQVKMNFTADATYEQLQYILNMGVIAITTPTGANPYTWTFEPAYTTANTPKTFTIQFGDNAQAWKALYCFATDWEISGGISEPTRIKATLVGQNFQSNAFTAALTPVACQTIVGSTGTFYVDSTWAGLGGTAKTNNLIDFSVKQVGGQKPVKFMDGYQYYTANAETKRHLEIEATLASNDSDMATLFGYYSANPQTPKFYRIRFTNGASAILNIDFCGVFDTFGPITQKDNQCTYRVKWVSIFDTTGGSHEWAVTLVNAVSTLV